jgi:stage V sporulation protein SpoVS
MSNNDKLLLVKSSTPTKELASAIMASHINGYGTVRLRGIGAGAIAQMVYAVTIANGWLRQKNVNLQYQHYYKDVPNEKRMTGGSNSVTITAIEYELKFIE